MRISAVHESRNVQHTKKCYATFVQQLLVFSRFTRPILQVHKPILCHNIPNKKRNAYSRTYHFFLKDCKCHNNFIYIILKACHCLLDCTAFVSRSKKCVQENWLHTRLGSICKVREIMCPCYVLPQDKIKQREPPL